MKPIVSICCLTYNHEKYIADAIDSFLMQKTNFPIEIIIHDDASTDRTADIIREYEKKHPDIIKGVYQTKNQYSEILGFGIVEEYIKPLINGQYVATCDGDDYWVDEHKLQKQVDFMRKKPEYIMCAHRVKVVNSDGSDTGEYLEPKEWGSRDYTMRDIIKGGFIHVSSRLYRKDYYDNAFPDWVKGTKYGDNTTALYVLMLGKVFFMEKTMSARRIGVENSLMTKYREEFSVEEIIKIRINLIRLFEEGNKETDYKWNKYIRRIVARRLQGLIHIIKRETNVKATEIIEYFPWDYREAVKRYIKIIESYRAYKEQILEGKYDSDIISHLEKNGIKKLAIYGYGSIGTHIKSILNKSDVKILYFIEDIHFENKEKQIVPISYVGEAEVVDLIIITPIIDEDFIKEDIRELRDDIKIASIQEVIA